MTKISNCILFFTVIITGAFVSTIATNYCTLKSCQWRNAVHTMCKHTSPAPARECGKWRNQGLTDVEKKTIVNMHNEMRRKVAAGKETRGKPGPQPAAVSMPDLVWDNELATIAQRWANQCNFNHDGCRDVDRFVVGQNLAYKGSTGENHSTVNEMVLMWYNEVNDFDRKDVSNFPRNYQQIGHYTQIVYGDTKSIGCGRIFYKQPNDKWEKHYLVCNYGPAGNYIGRPVYKIKQ